MYTTRLKHLQLMIGVSKGWEYEIDIDFKLMIGAYAEKKQQLHQLTWQDR